jgi:hypothetical protein
MIRFPGNLTTTGYIFVQVFIDCYGGTMTTIINGKF